MSLSVLNSDVRTASRSHQSEVISREVATAEESLKSSTKEVKEVKTQLQALEIELQSQLSMVRTPR